MLRIALRSFALVAAVLLLAPVAENVDAQTGGSSDGKRPAPVAQPRSHGTRVAVAVERVIVDDGDTVIIKWGEDDIETVRILGIDTPETRHVAHNIPYAQEFGVEARGFAQGAFAAATQIEILRSATLDPFGRTLGYLFVNGRNYSVLVIAARLAEESVSRYGDNGFPEEAGAVLAAAGEAGPLPFQSPGEYRRRMREVSSWLKDHGAEPEK